jgi:hypothetical protein
VRDWIRSLPAPAVVVYEAGPTGFWAPWRNARSLARPAGKILVGKRRCARFR